MTRQRRKSKRKGKKKPYSHMIDPEVLQLLLSKMEAKKKEEEQEASPVMNLFWNGYQSAITEIKAAIGEMMR